mmetsp:Transcript_54950/g.143887  ORF Transcript_54950/g.143887 Transcript_54950/m.143887 type:complete len:104 (-) Transcript_54950:490-801(-)
MKVVNWPRTGPISFRDARAVGCEVGLQVSPAAARGSSYTEAVVERIMTTTGLTEVHMQMQNTKAEVGLNKERFITESPAVRVQMLWNRIPKSFSRESTPWNIE